MRRAVTRRQGRRRNLILDDVPGAVRAPYPGFIEPCLATAREAVPKRGLWIHEIKHDGLPYFGIVTSGRAALWPDLARRLTPAEHTGSGS
jgi:hypothetical protein